MYQPRLESHDEIRRQARGALKAAGATDTLIVPLDAVATAVDLKQENLFELGEDAPRGLRLKVEALRSKLMGVLAVKKKTIYVDPDLVAPRHRFTTAHEIGHHALPWQESAYQADDNHNLSNKATEVFEREANDFAGELLFGAGRFNDTADSEAPGIATPLALASQYGTSASATLRQYAEHGARPVALLVVSCYESNGLQGPFLQIMENQCVWSEAFAKRYGPLPSLLNPHLLDERQALFHVLRTLNKGVGAATEISLDTSRGQVKFAAESFCNGRLRYVLLFKKRALSGQTRVLVGLNGKPLVAS
ncbi:MAG: ImmA/IrrE family metallo-endopeptidase [Pseudolysinimonas sp.]